MRKEKGPPKRARKDIGAEDVCRKELMNVKCAKIGGRSIGARFNADKHAVLESGRMADLKNARRPLNSCLIFA